eukprot:211185-Pelagomonas_calceolata.AAC.1
MFGLVRFEKENRERACPVKWGSCPALGVCGPRSSSSQPWRGRQDRGKGLRLEGASSSSRRWRQGQGQGEGQRAWAGKGE